MLLYNKWDLVTEREAAWKRLSGERSRRYPTLADLPAAPVSALTRTHLHRLPGLFAARVAEHMRKLSTSEINAWLEEVRRRRAVPSTKLGRTAKIYYATQTGQGPPEITLFVNEPSRISANYRRFVWSAFTDHFGFRGVPVRLLYSSRALNEVIYREELASLRHVSDAAGHHLGRSETVHPLAGELDAAGPERQESRDGAQGSGLPCPIAPDQGHRLALAHFERRLVHGGHVAVADLNAVKLEEDGHTLPRGTPR